MTDRSTSPGYVRVEDVRAGGGAVSQHADGQMVCPECGSSSYLIVDGNEMTEYDLLRLPSAPKSIERRLPHALWCPSEDHRLRLYHSDENRTSDE